MPTDSSTRLRVMQVISRLDIPAHTLVWSKTKPSSPSQGCTVDVIELPRLRLSFTLREHARQVREGVEARSPALWCDQHPGMFLSSRGDEDGVAGILQGLPHAVLLEDTFGNMFVLASAIAKPILATNVQHPANQLLSCGAQLDYTDPVRPRPPFCHARALRALEYSDAKVANRRVWRRATETGL